MARLPGCVSAWSQPSMTLLVAGSTAVRSQLVQGQALAALVPSTGSWMWTELLVFDVQLSVQNQPTKSHERISRVEICGIRGMAGGMIEASWSTSDIRAGSKLDAAS